MEPSTPAETGRLPDSATPADAAAAPSGKGGLWHLLGMPAWVAGGSALFLWAYWPTLVSVVRTWVKEPDYSHGFLVLPVAVFFLWARRNTHPRPAVTPGWGGLLLIAASVAVRILGRVIYLEALDAWSIPLWIAGFVWLLAGRRMTVWCWPSLGFLGFMLPLPWSVEHYLQAPMQRVAAVGSAWFLQCLGQPALAAGNTVFLKHQQLEVEQACSGLRMFLGIAAVAYALVVLVPRPWWQKLLLCLSIAPVAIFANILRITATGLVLVFAPDDFSQQFAHNAAGWLAIPVAAVLFGLILWWLDRAFTEIASVRQSELLRRGGIAAEEAPS